MRLPRWCRWGDFTPASGPARSRIVVAFHRHYCLPQERKHAACHGEGEHARNTRRLVDVQALLRQRWKAPCALMASAPPAGSATWAKGHVSWLQRQRVPLPARGPLARQPARGRKPASGHVSQRHGRRWSSWRKQRRTARSRLSAQNWTPSSPPRGWRQQWRRSHGVWTSSASVASRGDGPGNSCKRWTSDWRRQPLPMEPRRVARAPSARNWRCSKQQQPACKRMSRIFSGGEQRCWKRQPRPALTGAPREKPPMAGSRPMQRPAEAPFWQTWWNRLPPSCPGQLRFPRSKSQPSHRPPPFASVGRARHQRWGLPASWAHWTQGNGRAHLASTQAATSLQPLR